VPADLADVVTACLEPDPASRPTSASLLARLAGDMGHEDGALDLGPRSSPARHEP